ncbi:hypothetical protein GCM10010435_83880 [Winogradskya consettensis]|uniref:Uncharacterized protein n=2 Tax=Winogradskya consettensis TaxID=113560 RepID=A0A919SZG3_9ACTN|nr:hypothetical protein Aco04nite_80220 [Actinoplanes consettensis]
MPTDGSRGVAVLRIAAACAVTGLCCGVTMGGMPRWGAVAIVGGLLAWTALATPLNVAVGEYLAYYDPQSDPQRLEYHRDLAVHVYTAGHWFGQLVAAVTGAWLVSPAREPTAPRRPSRRS